MKKKIFIKTFGCQMNEYDSNRIIDMVKKIGFEKTDKYEDANCYLLNTCHIRDKAKEKVYHEIGRVKKIFRSKKKTNYNFGMLCCSSRKSGNVKKGTLH
jgi:tRNA-2-methylthio-N6-dimethylallyladenosine synthase